MDIMTIGKNIAELRKAKGVKQDELARFVGITAQAVSKWENGGVPDTELLPKIADYFNVSIDELFGRERNTSIDIQDAILRDITKTKVDDRISRAFELCWMIEQSMYGAIFSDPERFREEAKTHGENDQIYSQIEVDSGYTEMGLFNRMQYFLVVPDAKDKDKALLDGIDYLDNKGYSDIEIEVDGNVSFENAKLMKEAGANIFVVGTSSVFKSDFSLSSGIKKMREVIK